MTSPTQDVETRRALDTSGRVAGTHAGIAVWYEFEDLSPFQQGYVEALFADMRRLGIEGHREFEYRDNRFSDLSPAALAMIIRDCEGQAKAYTDRVPDTVDGGIFWSGRQGWRLRGFPPLTITLSDGGKIELAAQS
jgi:hypothetical protein